MTIRRTTRQPTSVDRLDFLLVLHAILEFRTITRAAEALDISQSALSHALASLRVRFRDPLFVRVKGKMQPTPLVLRFAEPLDRAMAIVRDEILGAAEFDPATSERIFKIRVNEIGAFVLMPKIIRLLRQRAPHASVTPVDTPPSEIADALEDGRADLAVGHYPELKGQIFQQGLFASPYVAIVRKDHRVGPRLTTEEFRSLSFIRCTATGQVNQWLLEQFEKSGRPLRIVIETPYVIALASLVAETDAAALVPEELMRTLTSLAPVRAVELPVKIPPTPIRQHWHRRYKDDGANRFLRELVFEALRRYERRS